MRKFIINILFFFALIVAIDLFVGYVGDYLYSHANGSETKRTNDLVLRDCHDVLILGSSRAHHHYDALFLSDTLGLDVYNAGYDGNGVVLAYGLLELILNRYKPQLIVYDVEPSFDIIKYLPDNNHKRYIQLLKHYYYNKSIENIIKDVSTEEWYKVHSGMMRYNTSIIALITFNSFKSDLDKRKGFSPLSGVYNREPEESIIQSEIDPFKIKYLNNLILLAKSYQIPIVFIASPKYGAKSSEIYEPVIEICSNNHVEFINYYTEVEFMKHKEWFKEPMHLNDQGARIYTSIIVNVIKSYLNIE